MEMSFGLSKDKYECVLDVLNAYSQYIEKVWIFGPRARGDYKRTSDIDLAIQFKEGAQKLTEILEALEDINIIHTFDVFDYDKIENGILKHYVDTEGVVIIDTVNTGGDFLNVDKLKYKLEDLKRAFGKLKDSAEQDPMSNDLVLDATIQRFEFTYELSWKLMKAVLEFNGNLDAASPRKAIKEAYKTGLITNGDIWLEMLQDRSRASHTYDEATAMQIFENIREVYMAGFKCLIENVEQEVY